MSSLVLTVVGPDRPGIVEAVSAVLATHGANWEGSRMAHLAGRFAGILAVTVAGDRADELTQALNKLPGLRVVVDSATTAAVAAGGCIASLSLVGNDRPGIIRDISGLLAGKGVNVEDLETDCEAAPMGGGTLFRMNARLRLPNGLTSGALRHALERVGHDLMVEISVEDA